MPDNHSRRVRAGESIIVGGRFWGRVRFLVEPSKAVVALADGTQEREVTVPRVDIAPASGAATSSSQRAL